MTLCLLLSCLLRRLVMRSTSIHSQLVGWFGTMCGLFKWRWWWRGKYYPPFDHLLVFGGSIGSLVVSQAIRFHLTIYLPSLSLSLSFCFSLSLQLFKFFSTQKKSYKMFMLISKKKDLSISSSHSPFCC